HRRLLAHRADERLDDTVDAALLPVARHPHRDVRLGLAQLPGCDRGGRGGCAAGAAPPVKRQRGVSLATDRASHLTPEGPKFACARASSPWPSMSTTTPSPKRACSTACPMRRPVPRSDLAGYPLPAGAARVDQSGVSCQTPMRPVPRGVSHLSAPGGSSSMKRDFRP